MQDWPLYFSHSMKCSAGTRRRSESALHELPSL